MSNPRITRDAAWFALHWAAVDAASVVRDDIWIGNHCAIFWGARIDSGLSHGGLSHEQCKSNKLEHYTNFTPDMMVLWDYIQENLER